MRCSNILYESTLLEACLELHLSGLIWLEPLLQLADIASTSIILHSWLVSLPHLQVPHVAHHTYEAAAGKQQLGTNNQARRWDDDGIDDGKMAPGWRLGH